MASFQFATLFLAFFFILGNNPSEGAKSDPLSLVRPIPSLCASRVSHHQHGGHKYLFSWSLSTDLKEDWVAARNYCRRRCMDTVAIETASEWSSLTTAMSRSQHWPRVTSAPLRPASRKRSNSQVAALWTSGRLCDFDGCEKNERFKPINVYGWFWSANNKQMSKTTCISGQRGCFHAWSDTGLAGVPQPDNFSLRDIRGNEGCLAITQNAYGSNEGFKWHDLGCVQLKHFVCEDSDKLIQYAKAVDRSRAHLI